MQAKLITTSAFSWMTCAFAGGAGWIVSLVLPHLLGGFIKSIMSAGGVIIAAAFFGYLQPHRPWRWAVASIVIPFMITAMRSESWLYVGVNPTSHNLWPFEILLAGTVAAPSSFLGAYAAILLTWIWSQRSRNNQDGGG